MKRTGNALASNDRAMCRRGDQVCSRSEIFDHHMTRDQSTLTCTALRGIDRVDLGWAFDIAENALRGARGQARRPSAAQECA